MTSATQIPPTPFVKKYVLVFLLLIIAPLTFSIANYFLGDRRGNWQTADRSSAGAFAQGIRTCVSEFDP